MIERRGCLCFPQKRSLLSGLSIRSPRKNLSATVRRSFVSSAL
jgi:hypothetical protein